MNAIEIPHGIPNLHPAYEFVERVKRLEQIGRPFAFEVTDLENEENWKIARRGHIGASDTSSVLGINSYKTRQQFFDEFTGRKVNPFKGNDQTRLGQSSEPLIRALWALEHPTYEVFDPTYLHFVSKARPWQSCSLDMIVVDPQTGEIFIGEIKTGMFDKKWSGAYCPDGYFAQLCHELEVTEFDGVFLLGRIRSRVMRVEDSGWEKHYFFTATNPAVMDERRRITTIEEKFYEDTKRGVLSPMLNLGI